MVNDKVLIIGAGLALGAVVALVVAKGGLQGAAAAVGASVVPAVDAAAGGAVQGAGTIVGVPVTDEARGRAAAAAGDWFEASKYLPAALFIRWLTTGSVD